VRRDFPLSGVFPAVRFTALAFDVAVTNIRVIVLLLHIDCVLSLITCE
jgi:hypothetical protein